MCWRHSSWIFLIVFINHENAFSFGSLPRSNPNTIAMSFVSFSIDSVYKKKGKRIKAFPLNFFSVMEPIPAFEEKKQNKKKRKEKQNDDQEK